LDITKDLELAKFLGIAQNTISAWKKRDSINYELIFEKCLPYKINLNWLIYGKITPEIQMDDSLLAKISSGTEGINSDSEHQEQIVNIIEMIRQLPWSVATRRIVMENYLYLIYREQKENEKKRNK
jgi:hypothetical protein